MFVGDTGVARVVQRTAEVMQEHRLQTPEDVRQHGAIDLPTIQRYLNFHYAVTMDLFGSDVSSNAATFYTSGLKGRYQETKHEDDHRLIDTTYPVLEVQNGRLVTVPAPALNALNEKLRDDFIEDTENGVSRWNKIIARHGVDFQLVVPHKAFHRRIGPLANLRFDPQGNVVDEAEWQANVHRWLPTEEDKAFVASLMGRVLEPGRFASWIAPPSRGINKQPIDFEYVRFG